MKNVTDVRRGWKRQWREIVWQSNVLSGQLCWVGCRSQESGVLSPVIFHENAGVVTIVEIRTINSYQSNEIRHFELSVFKPILIRKAVKDYSTVNISFFGGLMWNLQWKKVTQTNSVLQKMYWLTWHQVSQLASPE